MCCLAIIFLPVILWLVFPLSTLSFEGQTLLIFMKCGLSVSFPLKVCDFFFFTAHGGSQARGLIGTTAAGLHHSHSNARSEPCLRPTPQLTE